MARLLRWGVQNKGKILAGVGFGVGGIWLLGGRQMNLGFEDGPMRAPDWTHNPLPSRENQLNALRGTGEFDVLVIGGGATGCGVALDATTRGLSTALVEKYDFSSGTSSRSTKLIHGGVRYLQNAIMKLDKEQYDLVKEALHERANLLKIAPHLSGPLPIMLPVYTWWQVPYFWVGIKAYDLVAGSQCVKSSFVLSKKNALEKFPMLKRDKLKAAIVYYDGQHNDARMNLAIGLTAAKQGACIANHTEVLKLLKKTDEKTGKEKICGATVRDNITGQTFDVRAKCVINATGPFTDSIRSMDNEEQKKICQPSAGVHIILPGYYSPDAMGLLDPATSDGRVIFFLPWEGLTIAGTTDSPTSVTHHPAPREEDIQFILKEIKNYLSPDVHVRRGDVQAAWSGIRPLVTDPNSKNTQSISRNHVVNVSDSGLVTIAGGKWTTYRSMAIDAMDAAVKHCGLNPKNGSRTDGMRLDGGYEWTPNHYITLAQDYGLETDVAKHLSQTYGDQAGQVAKMAKVTGKRWPVVGQRLVDDFSYIEAEVKYAIYEYACTAVDVLARRTRLSFLNVDAAEQALPTILNIMQRELGWSKQRVAQEKKDALDLLYFEMGKKAKESVVHKGITLSPIEMEKYKQRFNIVDRDRKGFITRVDLQKLLQDMNEGLDDDTLTDMLNEVDLNKNGKVELDEFIEAVHSIHWKSYLSLLKNT
uniref:glycerol-3-phosphate dehydrogenase, mitochondrial isoform X2 n=1 Tax=Ciona intestinalis TaxID=7719 RepID=UPI00089DABB8|nr:glycerol-3-phosphate dehydrogenase, mitochondrial isoform X2 [Ciona intestinalis]|eukprot:XP_018670203.1 glycerol-3-phosphate dehydrogenase, mitochondrial isoform X2 [Ciona intestinalis]